MMLARAQSLPVKYSVVNSGVRIWKFCNPDPIRNFFIDSIPNPYPKI